jgi:hypothetical protein
MNLPTSGRVVSSAIPLICLIAIRIPADDLGVIRTSARDSPLKAHQIPLGSFRAINQGGAYALCR